MAVSTGGERMEFKLIRDGFKNYLQIENVEVKEEQYETQMVLQNNLPYFLKLEIRGINQVKGDCNRFTRGIKTSKRVFFKGR